MLRTQSLYLPPTIRSFVFSILESIVQPAFSALPKLDPFWHDPHAAPEVRHGNTILALESLLHPIHPLLQLFPPLQHRALRTGPGAYAGASDAGIVVDLTLLILQPLDRSLDADLSLLLVPPERETGLRITPHVLGLPARGPIAIYHEAPAVELFEVHEPCRDLSGGEGGGGEADGFRLVHPHVPSEGEPGVKLVERRRHELRAMESTLDVLVCLGVGRGTGRGD